MNQTETNSSKGHVNPGRVAVLVSLAFLVSCVARPIDDELGHQCGFLAITNFDSFQRLPPVNADQTVLLSPEFQVGFDWDELVLSWNTTAPSGTGVKVEARAVSLEKTTQFYILGLWSLDPAQYPRQSVNGQGDLDGNVQTDTLIVRQSASAAQIRLTLLHPGDTQPPQVKLLGLSFLNRQERQPPRPPRRAAWGRPLPVPERSQLGHANADGWCSPASVSMVLAYWARALRRPELDLSVPEVAQAVHDPSWGGTGNWCFNTAFAGQLTGLRAYVARLADLRALEDWVAAGIPPVASVSLDILQGHASDRGNGHLVVCAGFTPKGDLIVNDPWARVGKGQSVRRVYPRQAFLRAWARSKFTVYLIYPDNHPVP